MYIEGVTHDGAEALHKHLDDQGIKRIDNYPTDYRKDMGIDIRQLARELTAT